MFMTQTVRAPVTTIRVLPVAATVALALRLGPLRACVMTIVTATTHTVMNAEAATIAAFVNAHTRLDVVAATLPPRIETTDRPVARPPVKATPRSCQLKKILWASSSVVPERTCVVLRLRLGQECNSWMGLKQQVLSAIAKSRVLARLVLPPKLKSIVRLTTTTVASVVLALCLIGPEILPSHR